MINFNIVNNFKIEGKVLEIVPFGTGHINRTFLIRTDEKDYLLQRINDDVFKDVEGLMENVVGICEHLKKKKEDSRGYMTIINTINDKPYIRVKGDYWRVYERIPNTIGLDMPESDEDFKQSAVGIGMFINDLADFDATKLNETIHDFHNTVDRYKKFHEVLKKDPVGRAKTCQKEIDFVLKHEYEASKLLDMGLPLKVTHNDTKLNNVLLDIDTRKAICVIDLDTVMPGYIAYDFGDSIRFGASTALEDERDLSKVSMDINLYRIFTEGFLSAYTNISDLEKESLPWGAKLMTLECGVRFLTDYIDGDNYFATNCLDHNLVRARTQFKLVEDMERKFEEMERIVFDEKH